MNIDKRSGVIVAFGDSITAANWPRFFAERLQAAQLHHLSVSNQGIGGNRLLHNTPPGFEDWFGKAGVERFEREALDVPGAKYVIVLIGVNDLIHPGTVAPAHQEVSAAEMIGGYQRLIAQAHQRGHKIFGGTILPFAGYASATRHMETKRQTINTWIRTSRAFDAVIDFDKTMQDPGMPTRLFPAYDSGDHLHPNDEGARVLAETVDLELFRA
jgi:lysophospholipase L1-like esterase